MGISEIESLALILGGAFLVGMKAVDKFSELDEAGFIRIAVMVGGLAMLAFGIADIAIDHL